MNIIEKHERFEMEVLDSLRRERLLDRLAFRGGTMLRLCHQMQRYSVDLDFYQKDSRQSFAPQFEKMIQAVTNLGCEPTDTEEKHDSWLIELRRQDAPRRLKIEIRKDDEGARDLELQIAFSRFAPSLQVRLVVCTLEQMWKNKLRALLGRGEIRDAYDLEFLLRRGAGDPAKIPTDELESARGVLRGFSRHDFKSKLGSLLPPEERQRLSTHRFTLLEGVVEQTLSDRLPIAGN
jgi:predicted nucleotidyltransferase component of viral defense system